MLEGYSDASWISSMSDNKSTFGWIFTLGGVSSLGHQRNKRVFITLPWNQNL